MAPAAAGAVVWGNSGPLALAGFATTTFMLSMINANLVNFGTLPVVFAVAFAFGGLAQLIAGVIQLRTGNTFGGVLFTAYGAFWLSLFAIGNFFLKDVPATQVGHALGLFLYAFGIFTVIMVLASLRTSIAVVTTLILLGVAFFVLAAGNYSSAVPTPAASGLIRTGGWIGLVVAAGAFYLALAELCEATYGRAILPLGVLAKKPNESLGEE
ncbi:MAG: acetate uptake transporter [Streptosporangiaceae bacterium]